MIILENEYEISFQLDLNIGVKRKYILCLYPLIEKHVTIGPQVCPY